MPVTFDIKDERTIRCPVPATMEETQALNYAFAQAAADGYILKDASTWSGGNQLDPYTVGVILTFAKPNKEVPA